MQAHQLPKGFYPFRTSNRSDLAVLNVLHHRFEAVTLPSCTTHSVIDIESRIGKAVVLSEFLEDSFLVGDTVALAVEHIILAQTAV